MTEQGFSAPFGTGYREPDPQAVPALAGFDPSRGDKPRRRIEAKIEISADDWASVRRALRQLDEDVVTHGTLRNVISGGFDCGYAVCFQEDKAITHDAWANNLNTYLAFIDARDSDGSPGGRDAERLDAEGTTARAEGIAGKVAP